jgi:hypothetical protein
VCVCVWCGGGGSSSLVFSGAGDEVLSGRHDVAPQEHTCVVIIHRIRLPAHIAHVPLRLLYLSRVFGRKPPPPRIDLTPLRFAKSFHLERPPQNTTQCTRACVQLQPIWQLHVPLLPFVPLILMKRVVGKVN